MQRARIVDNSERTINIIAEYRAEYMIPNSKANANIVTIWQ